MNRLEALKAVEAAVANDALHELTLRTQYKAVPADSSVYIDMAFKGSLDAAEKLHDEAIPDWLLDTLSNRGSSRCGSCWATVCRPVEGDDDGNIVRKGLSASAFDQPNLARAWLLAIIRALITIEETKSHE